MSRAVEQIKERLTIVDVVSSYVKLTRAGKYWKGLSPFTKEKTASFFVTPDKGIYHCFSTGKGGDMFTFVEEMESVDFKGALKILAEKAGVELTPESRESRDERDQLFAALDSAAVFFESALVERADARDYILKRGVTEKTMREWRLGYAPKEWRALKDHLTKKGFSETTLLQAGLVKRPEAQDGVETKAPYDRFRGRIMFPIFDPSGRVIAFSGRIFEDDTQNPQAKYLNSPEGPLFDKSRALYGIHAAKQGIRELGFSMLVEGQFDLILCHQIGFRSAVATSGTAFTASHAEILKRYSENILLAYDGDRAGIQATYRAAALLLPVRMNAKVAALPEGKDPADTIATEPQVFRDAVKRAEPAIDFFLATLVKTVPDERKRIMEVTRTVLPLIAKVDNALDQAHFVKHAAEALSLPEERVFAELARIKKDPTSVNPTLLPQFGQNANEELLFGMILSFEEAKDERAQRVEKLFVSMYGQDRLLMRRSAGETADNAARVRAFTEFFELHQGAEAEENFIRTLESDAAMQQNAVMVETQNRLNREIREAERAGNHAEAERLMSELSALLKNLK